MDALKLLKSRTGVTPNILCRIALTLSLEEGKLPGRKQPELDGGEFNTHTLFGEYERVYDCFIRQIHGPLDARHCNLVVADHIDRGLDHLKKCKTLLDLSQFLSKVALRTKH